MHSSLARRFLLQTARRQHQPPPAASAVVCFRRSASTIPSQNLNSSRDDESFRQGIIQNFLEEYASMSFRTNNNNNSSEATVVRDNDALVRTMQYVQNQLDEVSLCIQDCRDETCNLTEELATANQSLERAVASLVDWLDEVRCLTASDANQLWAPQREQFVSQIKTLRQQLDELQKRV